MPRIATALLLVIVSAVLSTTVTSARQTARPDESRSRTGVAFRGGKTITFPNHLVITLLSYKRITGLTQFPGGPRALPRAGYRFVATTWLVRNTGNRQSRIGTFVARSRGMTSHGFTTGNAAQLGLVPTGATVRYYWLFQVAKAGKVSIFYGSYHAHWLPRE
jgi:hypothetical protein